MENSDKTRVFNIQYIQYFIFITNANALGSILWITRMDLHIISIA